MKPAVVSRDLVAGQRKNIQSRAYMQDVDSKMRANAPVIPYLRTLTNTVVEKARVSETVYNPFSSAATFTTWGQLEFQYRGGVDSDQMWMPEPEEIRPADAGDQRNFAVFQATFESELTDELQVDFVVGGNPQSKTWKLAAINDDQRRDGASVTVNIGAEVQCVEGNTPFETATVTQSEPQNGFAIHVTAGKTFDGSHQSALGWYIPVEEGLETGEVVYELIERDDHHVRIQKATGAGGWVISETNSGTTSELFTTQTVGDQPPEGTYTMGDNSQQVDVTRVGSLKIVAPGKTCTVDNAAAVAEVFESSKIRHDIVGYVEQNGHPFNPAQGQIRIKNRRTELVHANVDAKYLSDENEAEALRKTLRGFCGPSGGCPSIENTIFAETTGSQTCRYDLGAEMLLLPNDICQGHVGSQTDEMDASAPELADAARIFLLRPWIEAQVEAHGG